MQNNPYPVLPEDDGYDRFRNPYSPVWFCFWVSDLA